MLTSILSSGGFLLECHVHSGFSSRFHSRKHQQIRSTSARVSSAALITESHKPPKLAVSRTRLAARRPPRRQLSTAAAGANSAMEMQSQGPVLKVCCLLTTYCLFAHNMLICYMLGCKRMHCTLGCGPAWRWA